MSRPYSPERLPSGLRRALLLESDFGALRPNEDLPAFVGRQGRQGRQPVPLAPW